MIKKEIYPKTKRLSCEGDKIYITEKLDGSNLCIFKKDGKLYFAQRNNIFEFNELEENKDKLYKGLFQWLQDNKNVFEDLHENSVVCGEWLGMGKIKYSVDEFDKRFYMFAKANVDEDFNLYNLIYDHKLFIYPFQSQVIPNCIGIRFSNKEVLSKEKKAKDMFIIIITNIHQWKIFLKNFLMFLFLKIICH